MRSLPKFILPFLLVTTTLFCSESKNESSWGVSIPARLFENQLVYSSETEGVVTKSFWKIQVDPNTIIVEAEKGNISSEMVFSRNLTLNQYIDVDSKTEVSIKRENGKLISTIKDKKTGKETKKDNKIGKSKWIQEFTIGMKGFLLSNDKSCEFYTIHTDDLSARQMIATKEGIKKIQIGNQSVSAQKVYITLPGIQSWFWGAEAWYDPETLDLLLYKANSGPGTPMTTVTLLEKIPG